MRRLRAALLLSFVFMVVETGAGWWTGSLALLADAGHMLSDTGGLVIALVASWLGSRPPDDRRTLGWRRAEVLGATLNAAVLFTIAIAIVVEGIERLSEPRQILAGPMLVVATIGLLVNLVMAWMLARGSQQDINLRAAQWHVVGDALGSVGAMVAGLAILWGRWTPADAIASVVIAIIIGWGSVRILREAVDVLMQSAPAGVRLDDLRASLLAEEGVCDIHHLHLWSLAPGSNVLSVHVVLDDDVDPAAATLRIEELLRSMLRLEHVTVQVEVGGVRCCSPAAS